MSQQPWANGELRPLKGIEPLDGIAVGVVDLEDLLVVLFGRLLVLQFFTESAERVEEVLEEVGLVLVVDLGNGRLKLVVVEFVHQAVGAISAVVAI